MRTHESVPVRIIVAGFNDEAAADNALALLQQARDAGVINIRQAVVLSRDENDKLHLKDAAHRGPARAAAFGGVLGAALGLIAGAVALPLAVGAVGGAVVARLRDRHTKAELQEISDVLTPGTSAIVAVVEQQWIVEVEKRLAAAGARIAKAAIAADIAKQLEADGG